MSKVAIVTDTISCIPADLVKEYEINLMPVGLVIDRKLYLDTEISNAKFWEMFNQTREQITTSAVNPADFEAVFNRLAKSTDSICCIHVSKKLSATLNEAVTARENVLKTNPSLKIEIIDSLTATGAEGFIVLEAARAARSGKDLAGVVEIAEKMRERVKFVTAMQTLKYVVRSGRAPKSAVIGDWLRVKPILGMLNGSGLVENLGRCRGMSKAIDKMIDMVGKYSDPGQPLHVMVHYTNDIPLGEKIKNIVASRYNCAEIHFTPYTPVMASQTGPMVAISFYS